MKIEIDKPVVPKWFDVWYKGVPTEQDGYEASKEEHAIQLISQVGWGNGLYKSMSNLERERDEERVRYVLDNKMKLFHAILFGYEVEQEPLYYAKIKGWEHIGTSSYYFGYDEDNDSLEVTYLEGNYHFAFSLTNEHWNKLGINATNADFEAVE